MAKNSLIINELSQSDQSQTYSKNRFQDLTSKIPILPESTKSHLTQACFSSLQNNRLSSNSDLLLLLLLLFELLLSLDPDWKKQLDF